jgi:transcriptional regulator with XRE-family HTH domain
MKPATTYAALVGMALTKHRRRAGLSQAEVAALLGINQAAWSKIERGTTAVSVEYLVVLAPAFGVEPNVVMGEADRAMRFAEAQGVQVFRRRADMPPEAVLGLLGTQAVGALVEAAVAESGGASNG